ncbi:MAG: VOC family protein [Candidatus Limnocylindria bacterium]
MSGSPVLVELHVPDLGRARTFYERLGFTVVREESASADGGYLVMERGGSLLCFWGGTPRVAEHPFFGRRPRDTVRGHGVEIVIPVEDLDAAFEAMRATGRVVQEPLERPWGARDFRVEDPFGYYLRVTEPHDVRASGDPRSGARRRDRGADGGAPRRR